ncbi:MAG: DUF2157 domain-containing protein [Moorea sp. SIO2B7]|nr:DUF2157 domain-containing protein [Moorena sp. SIO2B7]
MASEKFRHQLRKEVTQWEAEGLIDSQLHQQLANRYHFSELDQVARNRFVMILLGLGSILLGLAVITFVAANWQFWSREVKVVLLLSLFTLVNTAGFYLWRSRDKGGKSRLGQGLLLLGGLILGANLALMSQMFHQSGSVYQLYLVWGLGVLAMAYSLRLNLLAILAVILIGIGYWIGIIDLYRYEWLSGFGQIIQHMPLLSSVIFIPLAYWCRSRWLFAISTVLVTASLEVSLFRLLDVLSFSGTIGGLMGAIAFALPPALLWVYRDSLWEINLADTASFGSIARNIAIFWLSILFYTFSFHFFWKYAPSYSVKEIDWRYLLGLLDVAVLGGFTILAWWRLGYSPGSSYLWRINRTNAVVAGMIITSAVVCWLHISLGGLGAIATLVFNILLFLLAVGLVREALANGKRRGFWSGIVLMVVHILSRMLEYDTGLIFKAIVLFLCGVGVIAAGLWFEQNVSRSLHP